MLRLSCFVLVIGVVLGMEINLDKEWEKFKSVHGKQYSGEEEPKRKEIFKKNVEAIVHHNLKYDLGETKFKQGINPFSDMVRKYIFCKNIHVAIFSIQTIDKRGVRQEHERSQGPRTHARNKTNDVSKRTERATLPSYMDWRDYQVVSPVEFQGYHCGSCWAYSATGAIEGAWAIATGERIVLSAQQLTDCATNKSNYDCFGCIGGWPYSAMQYVIDNNGQDKETCYPDLHHDRNLQ